MHTDFKDETEDIINNIDVHFETKINCVNNKLIQNIDVETNKKMINEEDISKNDTNKQKTHKSIVNNERETSD